MLVALADMYGTCATCRRTGPPHLDSDVMRAAAVEAARAVGQASGRTNKAVYARVWANLEAKVSPGP